jgi:hypothetical protein
MIEILPFLFISYYEDEKSPKFLKKYKIKTLIHLTTHSKKYSLYNDFENVFIELPYNIDNINEPQINTLLYGYLYDVVEFLFNKIINENETVCILGFQNKQDIDAVLMAYFIKYAKVNYQEAHHYVMSKKLNNYYDKSYYYPCLKKFIQQLDLLNKIDY